MVDQAKFVSRKFVVIRFVTKRFVFGIIILAASQTEAANFKVIGRIDKDLKISAANCEETKSCPLKRVFAQILTKEILVKGEKYYASDSRIGYETKNKTDIEEFAVVQLIKGCLYSKYISKVTGEETKVHDSLREFWGNPNFRFIHTDWVIDNTEANPYYTSFGEYGPHALLRWNQDPKIINPNSSKYYYKERPTHSTVYATDLPSAAYVYETDFNKVRKISSLKFKTCIIHKSFIDPNTDVLGNGIEWDKAVQCYEWDHNFKYNESLKKMELAKEIDPFCFQ